MLRSLPSREVEIRRCCVLWRALEAPGTLIVQFSGRGVPYLDLNWRDTRTDQRVLRYPLHHTSKLVIAEPIIRSRTYENARRENSQEKAMAVFKNASLVRGT
jgi:hypothetical protein